MIRLVIEVDDHPSWAECTKEAVAERLSELGRVRVLSCEVDKPQQMGMFHQPQLTHGDTCPKCGKRIVWVKGPDGSGVMRELMPRSFWPDPCGPEMVITIKEEWQRGRLEGDSDAPHTVGFLLHERVCKGQ